MRSIIKLLLAALLLTGCASVTEGLTQSLRVETQTAAGQPIEGAQCVLQNDYGSTQMRSGQVADVRRSDKDLRIRCSAPGQSDAVGRLVSRMNATVAGNAVLGGAAGFLVDHGTGSGYSYPSWVRLVFGQSATLDRRSEVEGEEMRAPTGLAALDKPVVLQAGDVLEYRIAERSTRRSRSVALVVEKADADTVTFQGGERIERPSGAHIRLATALVGELDLVTPPQGWPATAGRLDYASLVEGTKLSYQLHLEPRGTEMVDVPAGSFETVRIEIRGHVENAATGIPVRAAYRATAWMSPQLRRVVRFEAAARAHTSGGSLVIDERTELVRFSPASEAGSSASSPGGLHVGDSFDYRITDRNTGFSNTATLKVEATQRGMVSFNGGGRIEKPSGDVVRITTALAGELDMATPPGGWMPGGRIPSGAREARFVSAVSGARLEYDLKADAGAMETIKVPAGEFQAVRIVIRGWVENRVGHTPVRAHYEGTAWLAPALRRVVRFEAKARATAQSGSIHVDELVELTRIGRPVPDGARPP